MRRRVWLWCAFGALGLLGGCVTPTTPGNQAPVAVVGATPSSGPAPLTVAFTSAGSADPDGTIASYSWDFGDGSPTASSPAPSHTYVTSGTFTATLTVTDNASAPAVATTTITVDPHVNQSPVAVAAATPSSGIAPLAVSFSSAGSSDPDGTIASYSWDFGDGSPASSDPNPSHTYAANGLYVASLTVTDDAGAVNTATATVTVDPNQPPVAVATGTPTVGKAPLAVSFSSAGSNDPDGGQLTYSWDFGDGSPHSSLASPSHTYAAGTHLAVLTVTDPQGGTDTASVSIVSNANQPPVAAANGTPTAGQVPLTVNFSSAGSTDVDGGIVSWSWAFGDGNTSSQPNPTYTYSAVGTYTATLTVRDAEGATDTAQVVIDVNPIPNVPPTAAASGTPLTGTQPLTVVFSSAGSGDSDGTIVSYSWDFGDGGTSTQPNPSHTYTTPGTYTATLVVKDNSNGTGTATVTPIVVNVNQLPTAAANGTPLTGKEPLTVAFSSSGSSDPESTTLTYSWDFGDGGTSTQANPSHTYTAAGSYTAVLTVTDANGGSDTASVAISVVPNQPPVAVANAAPQSGPRNLLVSFDGSSSVDPDGASLTYAWNFGDGGTSTLAKPTHSYAAGNYMATLVVTDSNGAVDSDTVAISVYVDDDGDGAQPPADCNDHDATIKPGAADPLDAAGVDSNCDGVDGVASDTAFVKVTGGADSGTCGTLAAPCASIGQGIGRALATGKHVVQVAAGTYGRFQLASGVTVRGGYSQSFVGRSGTTTVAGSFEPSLGSYVGIWAASIGSPARVADLTVNAGGVAGSASAGVVVSGAASTVTLENLDVTAGTGTNPAGVLVQASSTVAITGSTVASGTATGAGSSAYGVRAIGGSTVSVTDSTVTASSVPGVITTVSGKWVWSSL